MQELKARIIWNNDDKIDIHPLPDASGASLEPSTINFSFGEVKKLKYNFFSIPYNEKNPFTVVTLLKNKLKDPKIKKIIREQDGYIYEDFDLRDFTNSLFLFLGKDDSKWSIIEGKYKEYILNPIKLI